MRTHVMNLKRYEYDDELASKLVVPEDTRQLITMLIEHREGGYVDIVRGKSGGAVVLLSGPPGVGKTLTAEVFAEAEHKALFPVQCAQLGLNPADLEQNLLLIFTRASRWGAILLLDEADVYVRQRGDDLIQNAIVGVFLRVLEYQQSILFFTTNRPDSVDDAIASRCIARINYKKPSVSEQKRIWQVLAGTANATLTDQVIDTIIEKHPGLSGRDIKNLLKLSMLYSPDGEITEEIVAFVKKFRPAADE